MTPLDTGLVWAISGGVIAVIGVTVPGIISIIRAVHENTKITQETKEKTIEIKTETEKIHELTNNNYSELKKELAESNSEIKILHKQVEQLLAAIGNRRENNGERKDNILVDIKKDTKKTVEIVEEIKDR